MKNIYSTWTDFNKLQSQSFKGARANELLGLLETHSNLWQNQDYPKTEFWKYVSYKHIPTTNLKLAQTKEPSKHLIDQDIISIEINNFSSLENLKIHNLPGGVSIKTQAEALESETSKSLINLFKKEDTENPFAVSALSYLGAGLVISVDEGIELEKPIVLKFNLTSIEQKDALGIYNLLIEMGQSSQAQVFLDFQAEKFDGLFNFRLDVSQKEKSQLTLCSKESGGVDSHIVYNLNANLDQEALLKNFDFTMPGQWTRHNVEVNLNQTKAEAQLRGAYLNNQSNFSDHHTTINHNVRETFSLEDYRGVLSDQAKAVFNGKVFIEEKAAKSNSEQINKNLMLSKKAEVNTKPELQIFNDDVKAAHGATVGQLDEEQRFYLQSRGYSSEQALQVLSKAFVLGLIDDEREYVKGFFLEDLKKNLAKLEESKS